MVLGWKEGYRAGLPCEAVFGGRTLRVYSVFFQAKILYFASSYDQLPRTFTCTFQVSSWCVVLQSSALTLSWYRYLPLRWDVWPFVLHNIIEALFQRNLRSYADENAPNALTFPGL